jgi:hypothetical protein
MVICPNCGGENSELEKYCDWCGNQMPEETKFELLGFIHDHFQSFAILGVFGALAFYLTSLISKTSYYVTLSGVELYSLNQSVLENCQKCYNFTENATIIARNLTLIGNITSQNLTSEFSYKSLFGISSIPFLQTGIFICYLIFILILAHLIKKLIFMKGGFIHKIFLTLLSLLFIIFGFYLVANVQLYLNYLILLFVGSLILYAYFFLIKKFEKLTELYLISSITLVAAISILILWSFAIFDIQIGQIMIDANRIDPVLGRIVIGIFSGIVFGVLIGFVIFEILGAYLMFSIIIFNKQRLNLKIITIGLLKEIVNKIKEIFK